MMKTSDAFMWNEKRYHSLDFELRQRFGRKIAKLPLDAGFTCPTRDGTKGFGGCLFCSSRGSGDFTRKGSITDQMDQQSAIAMNKWKDSEYIAYFQSYTNTYAPVEYLRRLFDEALSYPGTCGLAIATRCDCLDEKVLALLTEYNQRTFLWVEMGLQTSSDVVGDILRRGFKTRDFTEAARRLAQNNILTVAHIIAGLPGEGREDFLATVRLVNSLPVWGLKIQMLHILTDSGLGNMYEKNPFRLFDREEYVELVCDALEISRPDLVIHRLTGDGKRENLIAPLWTADKRRVLGEINQELKRRKTFQGRYWLP